MVNISEFIYLGVYLNSNSLSVLFSINSLFRDSNRSKNKKLISFQKTLRNIKEYIAAKWLETRK